MLIICKIRDATKDEKFGALSASQYGLVELAAGVFYRVLTTQLLCCTCIMFIFHVLPLPSS